MQSPMPPRLEPDAQKDVDASWNRAFTPIDRFDHQDLLDIMIGVQAYQLGVGFQPRRHRRLHGTTPHEGERYRARRHSDRERFHVNLGFEKRDVVLNSLRRKY